MNTLTMRNTGGTDHLSFDAVGIPGFQFIQDPLEYETRTHHSNMDVYDRLQPEDLKQMAVIVASFVYSAAMRDEMFPRKPIEKELPPPPREESDNASPATNPVMAERSAQPSTASVQPANF
jgi:Zn-dependent M28 family amino/carboxypeptidase